MNGNMPVIDPLTGQMATQKFVRSVVKEFDFSQLRYICLNLRIDAGATTYFSEIAMTQTLDNLRRDGTLDVLQYLERIPDKLIPRKQELLEQIRQRVEEGDQANAEAGAAIPIGVQQGGALSNDKLLAGMPVGLQARYDDMSAWERRSALNAVKR